MKTIFTFIFILLLAVSSYAQKSTTFDQKSTTITSGIIPEPQSFKITKVYPNPFRDFVSVELQSEVTGIIQVKLFNILGTEVKKWEPIYLSQGDQVLKIDLSSFKTGIYILKIANSGQVCTQVLKKN